MIIHFFKSRREERIDFGELYDNYFDIMDDVQIDNDEDVSTITINMTEFNFSYRFLITKRSRVSSIYKLNSDYVNVNMLVEIPLNIPQFLIRTILQQIDEMCKKFSLAIYYDQIDNIREFRLFEMLQALLKERDAYLANHPEIVKYKLPEEKLSRVCLYQKILKQLPSIVKADFMANPYIIMVNKATGKVELSINWRVGEPTILPPNLDYVHVEEEENLVNVVPIDVFMKYAGYYTCEIKDTASPIKVLFLNERGAYKTGKYVKKMRKFYISSSNFDVVKLINLIEE